MFGITPKLKVAPEKAAWIEDSFELLLSLFGDDWLRNAPLVLPNEQHFPRQWEETEDWARFAFERVCQIMHVDRARVELEFFENPWDHVRATGLELGPTTTAAGLYREHEEGERATICIENRLFCEPEKMVATMAHELAHVLLLGDKRIPREMERMEPLTDLMTVFCGFGIRNANSAFNYQSGNRGWKISRLGYLSLDEYGHSLAIFAWDRGETNPRWQNELSINVRASMKASLGYFRSKKRPSRFG